jgi:hypothetical protein
MRRSTLSSLTAGLLLGALSLIGDSGSSAGATTARVVNAANGFLTSLDEPSRAKAVFAFTDETQRLKWSNLPTGIFQRAGLSWGQLTAAQRQAALDLLGAALSPQGLQKVIDIMVADQVLHDTSGSPRGLIFSTNEFYLSFVGAPSTTNPWMLQFGGHHLALNLTIAGTNGVLTPSLTAAQPAIYTLNGKTVKPLGPEDAAGFALINALDASQKSKAIIGAQFRDLVLGPGKDGVTLVPEGIKGSELTPDQQKLLLAVAGQWVNIIAEPQASAKMAEIASRISETYFAWSGPTTPGSAAYFRIQGPTLVIEYSPQNLGGSPTQHIHTIYRDPTNDYGKKFTGR